MLYIACLATGPAAAKELQTLLFSIDMWHSDVHVHVGTDDATRPLLESLKTKATLHLHPIMNAFTGLTRNDMEARPGSRYPTLWHDHMMHKSEIMRRAFAGHPDAAAEAGVWFLDADITLLAPLPIGMVAEFGRGGCRKRLGLAPHYIRAADEAKFGRYNGGFVWLCDPNLLGYWERGTYGSRFYEQAALEYLARHVEPDELVEFPIQDNFGWWRLLQAPEAPPDVQKHQGFFRSPTSCGITFDGQALRSVHTHWSETTNVFNIWIRAALERLAKSHEPARHLYRHLTTCWKSQAK